MLIKSEAIRLQVSIRFYQGGHTIYQFFSDFIAKQCFGRRAYQLKNKAQTFIFWVNVINVANVIIKITVTLLNAIFLFYFTKAMVFCFVVYQHLSISILPLHCLYF